MINFFLGTRLISIGIFDIYRLLHKLHIEIQVYYKQAIISFSNIAVTSKNSNTKHSTEITTSITHQTKYIASKIIHTHNLE